MDKNFSLFDISEDLKQNLLQKFNEIYGRHGNKMTMERLQYTIMEYFFPHHFKDNNEKWLIRELGGENQKKYYAKRIQMKYDEHDNIIDFSENHVPPLDSLLEEIMIYYPLDIYNPKYTSQYEKLLGAISINPYDEIPFKEFLEYYAETLVTENIIERQAKEFAEKYLSHYKDLKSNGIETHTYN